MESRPILLTPSDRVTLHRLRQRERASLKKHGLLVWQHDMLTMCASGDYEVLLASSPRGSGKSRTCAKLVLESLVRGGRLHERHGKVLLVAASRTQAALVLEALVQLPGADAISVSLTGAKGDDGASCRVLGSDSRRAQGLGSERLVVADEPASWLPADGPRLWRALVGASGKRVGRQMVAVGTRSPASADHWWPQLLESELPAKWARIDLHAPDPGNWIGVLKANRYAAAHPTGPMFEVLRREFLQAREHPAARQQFVGDRCNGYLDEPGARVLDDDELARVLARPAGDVAVDATQSVVGVDMGGSLSLTGMAKFSLSAKRLDLFAISPPGVSVPGAVPSRGAVALPAEALGLLPPGPVGAVVADTYRSEEVAAAVTARGGRLVVRPPFRSGDVGAEIAALRMLLLDLGWAIGDGRALFAHALTQAEIADGRIRKAGDGQDDVLRAAMIGARYVVDQASRHEPQFHAIPHYVDTGLRP